MQYPENSFTVKDMMALTGESSVVVKAKLDADVKQGTINVVGKVQSGKRGRPALLFSKSVVPAVTT